MAQGYSKVASFLALAYKQPFSVKVPQTRRKQSRSDLQKILPRSSPAIASSPSPVLH
jgi:hypothetical protein